MFIALLELARALFDLFHGFAGGVPHGTADRVREGGGEHVMRVLFIALPLQFAMPAPHSGLAAVIHGHSTPARDEHMGGSRV